MSDDGQNVIRIEDEFEVFEIVGGEIVAGPVSTETDFTGAERVRWFEGTIYRKPDGTYVVYTVNESVVWHLPGGHGHVKRPERIASSALNDEDVYCGTLRQRPNSRQCPRTPPDPLPEMVLSERAQRTVTSCPDAPSVIREVSSVRRGDGRVANKVSDAMHELLEEARKNDPAFRGAKPVIPV